MKSDRSEIIRKARSGDLEAFREIHAEFARRILNFIYKMAGSREDAEDLAQNTFLRAFRELRNLQDAGRFEAWIYRIARNEVYQSFRRKRDNPALLEKSAGLGGAAPEEGLVDGRPNPQESALHGELGLKIRRVLGSLPPKWREVFILAVIHERSYSEIAEITGRSLLAVKTDIFRARAAARKALGTYLGSSGRETAEKK